MDVNGGIGYKNTLPWKLSEDLTRFREITMGHPIVMGRKTFESIGKALPGRVNIVLSRSEPGVKISNGIVYCSSPAEAIKYCELNLFNEIFIIGGADVYSQVINKADNMYLTEVHTDNYEVDSYFPKYDKSKWSTKYSIQLISEKNKLQYSFYNLSKIP